jgi:hypothetical protein
VPVDIGGNIGADLVAGARIEMDRLWLRRRLGRAMGGGFDDEM